jgi:hypothetical protein
LAVESVEVVDGSGLHDIELDDVAVRELLPAERSQRLRLGREEAGRRQHTDDAQRDPWKPHEFTSVKA